MKFAWKNTYTGNIYQGRICETKTELFESCGLGDADQNKPVKGYLAVEVVFIDGHWKEQTDVNDQN